MNKNTSLDWCSITKKSQEKIMGTDIFCEIICEPEERGLAKKALEEAFDFFTSFEKRFSRFKTHNELWELNESEGGKVSHELFALLKTARQYFYETNGLFDPSILPALESEGYAGAYQNIPGERQSFSDLILDTINETATKPQGLKIDLGGIGKGFAVDMLDATLSKHFDHFLIDAGGDIYLRGANKKDGYSFWAIDIENPLEKETSPATLLLRDTAVATSGINRRNWEKDGEQKHHIIDPNTQKSSLSDLVTVTVIAPETTRADILAKTLFLKGKQAGLTFANAEHIPAVFVDQTGKAFFSHAMKPYVWKA